MNFIGYRTLKTAVGAFLAMVIARELGLKYSVAAGIITILSIQTTKRQSLEVAIKRVIASILALGIAFIAFNILGYNEITFGIFILIFIPLTVKFKAEEGIVVSSVLVTHLLVEKSTDIYWMRNELALMLIGIGVALILNLYMPSIESQIKKDQVYIEKTMKDIFMKMAEAMRGEKTDIGNKHLIKSFEKRLDSARLRAYDNLNNYFTKDMSYYVKYMEMRIRQFEVIKRMVGSFRRFFETYEQTIMMADFTEKVARSIYEENTAEKLLKDLYKLKSDFRSMELPSTREEFENRASLFEFLDDMEHFLKIKRKFKRKMRS
ncbi:aromatic acid exporter family protein [Clostridium peptidivorans]|uniref:aromatic acid exporter family protein n=1 Tax=Clostridium peptidivorans TaxID=100174 RepID=UPI000BE2AF02|nr:aromatic acid exporter family protein [Clostridium peptidivorans]